MHNFLPVLALVFNAFVWGVSWWPFRQLHGAGVHPLWATALVFTLAVVGLLLARPGVFTRTRAYPALWLLALSSGLTNVAFNWAVTVGDVVRVVLVMVPADTSLQRLVGHLSGADLLALAGGFCFALTSVTLRRLHRVPSESRMLAMFGGGALMATASACTGLLVGFVPALPAPATSWVVLALLLAAAFLLTNYALQFGAARLAAGTTALIMLSEVVFASVSSVLLAGTVLDARTVLGGSLIVSAALLATLRWPRKA